MSKTALIQTKIDPKLKQDIDILLSSLGITTSQAINMFLKQVLIHGGIPFQIKADNSDIDWDSIDKAYEDIENGRYIDIKSKQGLKDYLNNLSK